MSNPFFTNNGPFKISEIFQILKIELKIEENLLVNDIQDLNNADKNCIRSNFTIITNLNITFNDGIMSN